MSYHPYQRTPACNGRLENHCHHEDASKAMYENVGYWRARARSAEGALRYRDRMASYHRRRRAEKARKRDAQRRWKRKSKQLMKKQHKVTARDLLLKVRSFKDIAALESQKDELDMKSPQIRQLVAMIPGSRAIEELVGLEQAKKHLFELLMNGLLRRLVPADHPMGDGFQNIVLLGPPGVGKTSLMNAFGELCRAGGITRKATVTMVHRVDLVGQYLGSTAVKTQKVVDSAKGGILMIDEVYSLGSPENRDMFAKEAIDVMTGLIDKYRDDLIVVVAGYPGDVEHGFFAQNRGLERRFPHWITLDAYSPEQLAEIFRRNCAKRGWEPLPDALERLKARAKEFSHNASDAVQLVSHINVMQSHALWASAVPLPHQEVARLEREQEEKQKQLDHKKARRKPLYVALADMIDPQRAGAPPPGPPPTPHVPQVQVSSIVMQIDAETIDRGIERLLAERAKKKQNHGPPSSMYI